MAAVLLIVSALVCIFVAEGWAIEDTHQICGIICVILAFIQPFGALFRCGPTAPKRPIFNWLHRLVGVSAWILAGIRFAVLFESQIFILYCILFPAVTINMFKEFICNCCI